MIFQYPSFLWALWALTIPIIIHLFNFRKTTRIYFSNTRFLRQVKQETTQKRKLKQYLVLASRLFFLFFLVMAFAQPFLVATDQIGNQKNVSIYLDNSQSMSVPAGEKLRALDVGIRMVEEIVNLFPSDVRYQVITNDFAPFSNSFKTKLEVLDYTSQVRVSPISRTSSEVVKRLKEKQGSMFWISDFQRSTFGTSVEIDSTMELKLVPIQFRRLSNVFVDTIYLDNPYVVGIEKNALKVRLNNESPSALEGLVVKLAINDVQASAAAIDIEPNSTGTLSFDLATTNKGLNKAVLSISDYPASFDNDFNFTLNYSGKLKVIEIKQEKEITFIEKVYGNKDLFSFSSFLVSNLNYSKLANADLVIVNGVDNIEPSLQNTLATYKKLNSLLIIPGSKPNTNTYQEIVGVPLKVNTEDPKLIPLKLPDFQNPMFQNVFEERSASMTLPFATKLLDWGVDRSAILHFKDGRPFMSQMDNLFIISCPLAKDYTDFYTHALFVPILYRMAAVSKRGLQKPYYSLSSSLVSISTDSMVGEEPLKMKGKQEVIPIQKKQGDHVLLEVPKYLLDPGFYYVAFKKDTLDLLAFNQDKSESKLASLSGEEAKAQFGGGYSVSIFYASSPEAFRDEIKERYLGQPLWKYALVLALLFLLVEVLLIRFLK